MTPELKTVYSHFIHIILFFFSGSGIYDKASDGASVRITRCVFDNVATHRSAPGMSHDPLIVYGSGSYHGDNRSYDCGGVLFDAVSVVDHIDRVFMRGDVPLPRVVRGVHGSIHVTNPFGCNTSFPTTAKAVDVTVSCSAQP